MEGKHKVGVIGGSGLYDIDGLEDIKEVELETPFGSPSDAFITGELEGVEMVFLPRHGRGHRISPTEINSRANLWGMKKLGVSRIISVSAVGSMKEEIPPGDFVLVDQFFDRTRHRPDTFFEDGVVAHVMFADPICPAVRGLLLEAAEGLEVKVHDGGTYLNMEGPQFSTRAESLTYRTWGVEVRLAREAEIGYATVAMSTDYDCWHTEHDDVSVATVVETMKQNVTHAKELIRRAAPKIAAMGASIADDALEYAVMTAPEAITSAARERLALFLDKYLDGGSA
ncbi:MAG: S-methyl-5'-thioadenosine phosphorylase [Planctomycetes bacterium]|nr:S-methyl-5'-thioadenosine phosphorylase [Planctomycetota bacterium]